MRHFYRKIRIFCLAAVVYLSVSASLPQRPCTAEQDSISMAEQAVELFYRNKDLGDTNDLSALLDPPILSLLADKADAQQYVSDLYENAKQNYRIRILLLEKRCMDTQECIKFQVITSFQYQKTPDVETEVSEVVYVIYDSGKKRITDVYAPDHFYDMAVRDLGREASSDTPEALAAASKSELVSRQNTLKDSIARVYRAQLLHRPVDGEEAPPGEALDADRVIAYARGNYNKATPAAGSPEVLYYDFSQITGNYDCTNFVSHALLAGGAHPQDPGGTGISSKGWYYRSLSNRSSSWSGVNQLYRYLVENTAAHFPCGIARPYSQRDADWEAGAVLQFGSTPSAFYHSTIITVKTHSYDGGKVYAYVTGRSSDVQYNNNQAADDAAPDTEKRVIAVYNRR